ncbi:hypothetical protein I4U23_016465 [Adineta vaga]|nr:hypothetical protein I4U23_016465 [Adineta vaga]
MSAIEAPSVDYRYEDNQKLNQVLINLDRRLIEIQEITVCQVLSDEIRQSKPRQEDISTTKPTIVVQNWDPNTLYMIKTKQRDTVQTAYQTYLAERWV